MAFYQHIIFPRLLYKDTYYQIKLKFEDSSIGADATYTANDQGMTIIDWGELDFNFDIDNYLLVPAVYAIRIADVNSFLKTLLFNNTNITKKFYLELFLNDELEFSGYVQEDSIDYNFANKTLSVTFDPQISIINKLHLFDPNGDPLYTTWSDGDMISFLHACFKHINPDLLGANIIFKHDWLMSGKDIITDDVYEDIPLIWAKINPVFFLTQQNDGIGTIGDALRALGKTFCAITGMISKNKAFFIKLFHYDGTDLQTINGTLLSRSLTYKNFLIDYIVSKINRPSMLVKSYPFGDSGKYNENSKFEYDLIASCSLTEAFFNDGISLIFVADGYPEYLGSDTLQVFAVKDPVYSTYVDLGEVSAKYWYQFRNNMSLMCIERFTFTGVNYNYYQNFNYDGRKYQIIRLRKSLSEYKTEIDAINLGAV